MENELFLGRVIFLPKQWRNIVEIHKCHPRRWLCNFNDTLMELANSFNILSLPLSLSPSLPPSVCVCVRARVHALGGASFW